ncbi:MAG: [Kiritimatiellae bacterium]|nr:[FeFe] hydrogenase H-cluster maturation GTPase HydF [Kiritimatiellia bacterium]
MSTLNETPRGERTHIAFFGRRNAGKSSLVNALAGQPVAIVSPVKGTTTDPVYKSMELLPLGPVELIDTPGLDDEGDLGGLRVQRTREVLERTDIAVVVTDASQSCCDAERELLATLREKAIPFVWVRNKIDLGTAEEPHPIEGGKSIDVSAVSGEGVDALRRLLASMVPETGAERTILQDLIKPNEVVVLVTPIDSAAPKGRLILPQQETLRDVLDRGAVAVVAREAELREALRRLSEPPALVVTDSQAFAVVSQIVPREIPLTSFSILFARYKGDLDELVRGANKMRHLQEGDRILIAEGCTHLRKKEDIGTVKIPKLLQKKTGKTFRFTTVSGMGYPPDLSEYALVIHCGGCMLNRREVCHRIRLATEAGVAITNYGVALAELNGILHRCLEALREVPGERGSK